MLAEQIQCRLSLILYRVRPDPTDRISALTSSCNPVHPLCHATSCLHHRHHHCLKSNPRRTATCPTHRPLCPAAPLTPGSGLLWLRQWIPTPAPAPTLRWLPPSPSPALNSSGCPSSKEKTKRERERKVFKFNWEQIFKLKGNNFFDKGLRLFDNESVGIV
jgi:hypothetical protein